MKSAGISLIAGPTTIAHPDALLINGEAHGGCQISGEKKKRRNSMDEEGCRVYGEPQS